MKAFPSRSIQFAAALSLAVMAQANLLMASFSPCGLPFGHDHFGIGHIDPAALRAHLAAEAACRMGIPQSFDRHAVTDAYGRVVSEPSGGNLAHVLDNLSVLIGFAVLATWSVVFVASDLSSRLKPHRLTASPPSWRPPIPPPRPLPQTAGSS